MTHAVFPGSFDPLTVAHLAIADAVHDHFDADPVELVISVMPLAKDRRRQRPISDRVDDIRRHGGTRPWLRASATEAQLLVEIADGADLLVVGADKWHQLHDPAFYGGSATRRDEAIAALPEVAVFPRAGVELPAELAGIVLAIDPAIAEVSSTAVRQGRDEWRA